MEISITEWNGHRAAIACVVVVSLLGFAGVVQAQQPESAVERESAVQEEVAADQAVKFDRESVTRLDAIVRRMEAFLNSLPGYEVQVVQEWQLEGPRPGKGVNRATLRKRHDGAFHLEVPADSSSFACAGDGETITRLLTYDGQSVYSKREGDFSALLQDVITETSLRHTGLDLLCRDDPHEFIMVMAADVKSLGEEKIRDTQAEHFRMQWGDTQTHQVDVWISGMDKPLPQQIDCKLEFTPESGEQYQLSTKTRLTWKTSTPPSKAQCSVKIPRNAMQVADIHHYLIEGGTLELLGQPAPSVPVKLIDGGDWNLKQHQGEDIVLLYFYATWAVPSQQEMPRVLEFIETYGKRGVVFYAVDAGEDVDVARAFAKARKYDGPVVVDAERKLALAYRVTALPAIIIIGKDGTIQSAHVGNTPESRAEIRSDLEQLLEGKVLAEPAEK